MLHFFKIILYVSLALIITSCGTSSKSKVDYKKSVITPTLELPPDLINSAQFKETLVIPKSNNSASLSDYNDKFVLHQPSVTQQPRKVLPVSQKVQIKRNGQLRWLVLQGEPDIWWIKVKQFWITNSFTLKLDNPAIGIMETNWAENRADIPQEGIRKYLSNALGSLYSAPTRDKFKTRLEIGQMPNTTEIYLTHKGVEEIPRSSNEFIWQNRPVDHELEAEMLNRLMVFIGIDKEQIKTLVAKSDEKPKLKPLKAELIKIDGEIKLLIYANIIQAWQRTALAIDRLDFTIEDRNRSKGIYFIRYINSDNKPGFLANLFSSNDATEKQVYQIQLSEMEPNTYITVFTSDQTQNKTAKYILNLLYQELK
ncbi:MAG: outer membrane protein assembly factor BamC [Thiomargarita sp.]|nr:outer membrane protein assembly factor BamC [Thiomargarita sp.]